MLLPPPHQTHLTPAAPRGPCPAAAPPPWRSACRWGRFPAQSRVRESQGQGSLPDRTHRARPTGRSTPGWRSRRRCQGGGRGCGCGEGGRVGGSRRNTLFPLSLSLSPSLPHSPRQDLLLHAGPRRRARAVDGGQRFEACVVRGGGVLKVKKKGQTGQCFLFLIVAMKTRTVTNPHATRRSGAGSGRSRNSPPPIKTNSPRAPRLPPGGSAPPPPPCRMAGPGAGRRAGWRGRAGRRGPVVWGREDARIGVGELFCVCAASHCAPPRRCLLCRSAHHGRQRRGAWTNGVPRRQAKRKTTTREWANHSFVSAVQKKGEKTLPHAPTSVPCLLATAAGQGATRGEGWPQQGATRRRAERAIRAIPKTTLPLPPTANAV